MKELLEKLCKDAYFLDTVATAFGQSLAEEKIKEKARYPLFRVFDVKIEGVDKDD